jgi:NAD(P)-dependent dehydrogenase (short-subunit alcohol dehydrogenase family)
MTRTAVIAGVGPGLGESLARKFAAEGCQVALFARSAGYIEELGLYGIANRAVFVIDEDAKVRYNWIADDPTNEPDYDEVLAAVRSV